MILLLVIAMLVLLALMGTIFILMASTDRKSAYAANSSASLNLAQQGVLNTVRGLMLSQTLDENGQTLAVGSYNSTTHLYTPDSYSARPPATTGQIARFWDYPEVGAIPAGGTPSQFYQTAIVAGASPTAPTQYAPSEPWLVSNQPYEPNDIPGTTTPQTLYVPGEEVYYATENTVRPFNVTGLGRYIYTGAANVAAVPPALSPPTASPPPPAAGWMAASGPSSATVGYAVGSDQPKTGVPLLSTLSPYLYDPYTGNYSFTWTLGGTASATNVVVPNAAVVAPRWAYNNSVSYAVSNQLQPTGTLDAMWNLLPYSSPNGTRYRFATRIVDMSSMLNLNAGWIPSADPNQATDAPYAEYGAYTSSCPILNNLVNAASADIPASEGGTGSSSALQDNTSYLQAGNNTTTPAAAGRIGSYPNTNAFYSLPTWQNALNEYEIQYPNSASPPTAYSAFFGANSEMDLLTAAGAGGAPFGSPYYSRVATLLPGTLGLSPPPSYYGSGYRSLYTTYSWGRDVAAINPGTSTTGTAPPKLNLNASVTDKASLMSMADNLYTSIVTAGYDPVHARDFLANYFTYRFDTTGYSGSPATLGASNLLTVPMGGSTISTTLPLATVPAGVACTGTTAQPFLNEAEFKLTVKSGSTVVSDWAIEVANPFSGTNTLPCTNYSIEVYFGASKSKTLAFTVPLTRATLAAFSGTAGNSYIGVVALSGGALYAQAKAATDGFLIASGNAFQAGTATIDLVRNNVAGGTPTVVMDTMAVTIPTITAAQSPTYYDVSRENSGLSDGIWGCDSSGIIASSGTTSPPAASIGTINPTTATGGKPGVVLYDRWYSGDLVAPGAAYGNNLANINDFNCIARECTIAADPLTDQIDQNIGSTAPPSALVPPANLGMYYVGLAGSAGDPLIPAPAGSLSPEIYESALYFDFAYDPRAAFTAADAGFPDPQIVAADTGEIPPTILSTTTLTDRSQSNTAAASALPGSNADLVRQAGKININTAGPDVLYSIFSEDGALSGDTTPVQQSLDISALVDDAIAFRQRLAAGKPGLPLFAVTTGSVVVTPVANANNYSIYAGTTGFRSNADLLVALLPTIESGKFPTGQMATPTTLQQRDAAWADVENFITVRSDTFAVYGLVQALRLNPAYVTAGGTYTPTDWYNANQGILVGTGAKYYEGSISTDPTSQNAEFILRGSRRFIAIVDRSYCNNGTAVQPHIVALKILPQ